VTTWWLWPRGPEPSPNAPEMRRAVSPPPLPAPRPPGAGEQKRVGSVRAGRAGAPSWRGSWGASGVSWHPGKDAAVGLSPAVWVQRSTYPAPGTLLPPAPSSAIETPPVPAPRPLPSSHQLVTASSLRWRGASRPGASSRVPRPALPSFPRLREPRLLRQPRLRASAAGRGAAGCAQATPGRVGRPCRAEPIPSGRVCSLKQSRSAPSDPLPGWDPAGKQGRAASWMQPWAGRATHCPAHSTGGSAGSQGWVLCTVQGDAPRPDPCPWALGKGLGSGRCEGVESAEAGPWHWQLNGAAARRGTSCPPRRLTPRKAEAAGGAQRPWHCFPPRWLWHGGSIPACLGRVKSHSRLEGTPLRPGGPSPGSAPRLEQRQALGARAGPGPCG